MVIKTKAIVAAAVNIFIKVPPCPTKEASELGAKVQDIKFINHWINGVKLTVIKLSPNLLNPH